MLVLVLVLVCVVVVGVVGGLRSRASQASLVSRLWECQDADRTSTLSLGCAAPPVAEQRRPQQFGHDISLHLWKYQPEEKAEVG